MYDEATDSIVFWNSEVNRKEFNRLYNAAIIEPLVCLLLVHQLNAYLAKLA